MIDGLLINRTDFKEALDKIRRTSKAKGRTYAHLYFGGGQLKIQVGTFMRQSVKAKGEWPKPIAVNAVMLGRVGLDLPKEDPILLQAVQGQLYIGTTLSVDCKTSPNVPDFLDVPRTTKPPTPKPKPPPTPARTRDGLSLPANASSRHVIEATQNLTKEEIAMSGLSGRVEKALMDRNRRITVALKELAPFGIKHGDLIALISDRLRKYR